VNFNVKVLLIAFSLVMTLLPVFTVQAFTTASETAVFVHPAKATAKVNQTFQVSVNVSLVSKLQGFDFMLTYDTRLLDCLSVEEGTFLSAYGSTFVAMREINDSFSCNCGRVWFAVVILEKGFADGNGTLAIITFKAVSVGETVLDLYSGSPLRQDAVKLTTCNSQSISNKAFDGQVTVTATNDPSDPPPQVNPEPPQGLPADPPSPDVNGDGIVNIADLAIIAFAYGTVKGDVKYNAGADLDQNDKVNIVDITLATSKYMRSK